MGQILKATTHKTAALRPLTSHLTSHPRKNSYRLASFGRSENTYIYQLCMDTRCSLEDLPGAMDQRDGRKLRQSRNSVISDVDNHHSLTNKNGWNQSSSHCSYNLVWLLGRCSSKILGKNSLAAPIHSPDQ